MINFFKIMPHANLYTQYLLGLKSSEDNMT